MWKALIELIVVITVVAVLLVYLELAPKIREARHHADVLTGDAPFPEGQHSAVRIVERPVAIYDQDQP